MLMNEVRELARPWAWRLARLAHLTLTGLVALVLLFACQAILRDWF